MNSPEGESEEDQKSQRDVDFIPYDLLEESGKLSEGVFGIESIFKPTNERRTLFMVPSKPEEWFTNELASAFRLEHVNIIKIYGRTCVDGVNGILTECVEGTSLEEVIRNKSISYTLGDVLRWNIQSFSALEYVIQTFPGKENEHFRRYFHRTVCPQNMILNPTLTVLKICALGLFKDIPDSKDWTVTNYPYYWAPEVRNGEEYRYEESDVYPFVVVLYECLTGAKQEVWFHDNKICVAFIELPRKDSHNPVDASYKFNTFLRQCTDFRTSSDRLPVSVILTILENMVPAGKEENLDLFKIGTISFWNEKELYYCKKFTFFEEQKINGFDIVKIFDYNLLKNLKDLASGSFGKVCLAEYEDKRIAIKFLIAMKMHPFLKELSILTELKHENLIKAIGETEKDGVYGIVMEYIDGTSLHKIIHERPAKYSLGDVLKWNYQAACALEYMHSKRLLHRDVKPQNMLIENSENRTLKLVDLGGAKMIQNSRNFTEMGTELYIAPEVEKKEGYTEKCDVYSWTITFRECLTAEQPQRPPVHQSKVNQICSAKFVEIIKLCCSPKPSQRKIMFIIEQWLGHMLNHQKAFTDTDSTFRENHICVWNEQTNELYYCAKTINVNTASERHFKSVLNEAKTFFVDLPMGELKVIQGMGDKSRNVKFIDIGDRSFNTRSYHSDDDSSEDDSDGSWHNDIISHFGIDSDSYSEDDSDSYVNKKPDQRFQNDLTRAKTSFMEIPMNKLKIVAFKGAFNFIHKSGNAKVIEIVGDKKILQYSKDGDKKRLENEFVILSKLKHENIVKLYGYTHDKQLNYFGIIKQFIFAANLETTLSLGFFSTEQLLHYGLETANGLEYMHSQNILHCNVKPASIIRTEPCKICDFSLARDLQYAYPKEAVGTGIYMAPEVRQDGSFTTKSDVYSWAVTFWLMFKFVPETWGMKPPTLETIADIKQMESIDLCEAENKYKIENASDKFNEFIQTCANADPDKRWSMTDIIKLLENMLKNPKIYIPNRDNIEADINVRDNQCLWIESVHWNDTKNSSFYAFAGKDPRQESEANFRFPVSSWDSRRSRQPPNSYQNRDISSRQQIQRYLQEPSGLQSRSQQRTTPNSRKRSLSQSRHSCFP